MWYFQKVLKLGKKMFGTCDRKSNGESHGRTISLLVCVRLIVITLYYRGISRFFVETIIYKNNNFNHV